MRWFYFQYLSISCWVRAKSMEAAAARGCEALLAAYRVDASRGYQVSTCDGPRRGQSDQDQVFKDVYWDTM